MDTNIGQPTTGQATDQPAEPQGTTVCIAKQADGSFQVYPEGAEGQEAAAGKTVKTIEEALAAARELLVGNDGGMSVEEAFRGGFQGSEVPQGGGTGGGY